MHNTTIIINNTVMKLQNMRAINRVSVQSPQNPECTSSHVSKITIFDTSFSFKHHNHLTIRVMMFLEPLAFRIGSAVIEMHPGNSPWHPSKVYLHYSEPDIFQQCSLSSTDDSPRHFSANQKLCIVSDSFAWKISTWLFICICWSSGKEFRCPTDDD